MSEDPTMRRLFAGIARMKIQQEAPDWRDHLPLAVSGEGWECTLAEDAAYLSAKGRAWRLPWHDDLQTGLMIGETPAEAERMREDLIRVQRQQNTIATNCSRKPTEVQERACEALELVADAAVSRPHRLAPDARQHNPAPDYLRGLIAAAGLSQREAARRIGVSERSMRQYLAARSTSSAMDAPYAVQYALERLCD